MIRLHAILFLFVSLVNAAEEDYTIENYPNPKRGGFKECGLRAAGSVCDPYEALSESDRYRINNLLVNFASKTKEAGNDFCHTKGTDAMFLITNQASQQFADGLRRHWGNMDAQCGRFGVLVLSRDDRRMYGSFDERSPIKSAQLDAIIATADEQVKTGAYTAAVTSILKEVAGTMTPQPVTSRPPVTTTKLSVSLNVLPIIFISIFYQLF